MSKELVEKAKRMVDAYEATVALLGPILGGNSLNDMAELARAYLAEHREDDDEPVDAAWLESVGFKQENSYLSLERLYVLSKGDEGRDWIIGPTILPWQLSPKTRGDVRRLCATFKIPLGDSSVPTPPRQ